MTTAENHLQGLRRKLANMKEPPMYDDGACRECIGRHCDYHKIAADISFFHRMIECAKASKALQAQFNARIAAQYELESDQFYSVEDKVEMVKRGEAVARY